MINRENYLLLQKYLSYRKTFDQIKDTSARLEEGWLHHTLEWAKEQSFAAAYRIKPPFPLYLMDARRDGKKQQLSRVYVDKIIRATRRFFTWLRVHVEGYSTLTEAYIDTLRTPRMRERPRERDIISIEQVRKMAQTNTLNLREERIKAAVVFMFLSGIRVRAFTTLPLETVDIENRIVRQWPTKGVRTKNDKHATTYLLNIPDLLLVVKQWDSFLRSSNLPADAPWFAALSPTTGELDTMATVGDVGEHRHTKVRRDLTRWCELTGLPYYSPHKFRHGHAVYSLTYADTVADLKAISQNMMHKSLKITDEIYAVLADNSVQSRIAALGQSHGNTDRDISKVLRALADQLEGD